MKLGALISISISVSILGCGSKEDGGGGGGGGGSGSGGSGSSTAATATTARPVDGLDTTGIEYTNQLVICKRGVHARDGVRVDGSVYAVAVEAGCDLTLRKCVLNGGSEGRPAIEVIGGTLRLEECTVTTTAAKSPALWVSQGGKVTVINSTLSASYKYALDVWKGSVVGLYKSTFTGDKNVEAGAQVIEMTSPSQAIAPPAAASKDPVAAGGGDPSGVDDGPVPVYAGTYRTTFGVATLTQTAADPKTVTGKYPAGTLTCQAGATILDCRYKEGSIVGGARFKRDQAGNLAGTFGLGKRSAGQGPWKFTLTKAGALN